MKQFDLSRSEFAPYGFTCERWEPKRMPRPDRHNEVELNLLDDGTLTYAMWGKRVEVHGGRLAVFWAAAPHQIIDYRDVAGYYVVTVPLAWVLSWDLPDWLIKPLLNGRLIQEPDEDSAEFDRHLLNNWLQDLNCGEPERCEITLLELKARLLRLALRQEKNPAAGARSGIGGSGGKENYSKVEEMAKFVVQNYTRPIKVEDIARHVGLHPDYAATLFRKTFGTTLNRFVTDHRIHHAQRMLVTTDAKIIDVAFQSGFNSLSRFNAAFKALCGCTPRRYRNTHRL